MRRAVEFQVTQHVLITGNMIIATNACGVVATHGHRVMTLGVDTFECSSVKAEIWSSIALVFVPE
ncbi:hypothetical protein D3C85_1442350 [compost metagenome]